MRVLTWNLFHGRAVPGAGRDLQAEFTAALAGWPWDVALLQEVPPWWPSGLAAGAGADQRVALTSRNTLSCLRRALARRWPDLLKSEGGGANALLVRPPAAFADHRVDVLATAPERRVLQLARLRHADAVCVANMHLSAHDPPKAAGELERARAAALRYAGGAPLVLGGDVNLRRHPLDGLVRVADRDVDALYAQGLRGSAPARVLAHGSLSDHPPLTVDLMPA
ncbi:MAG TPA: endonuclease/exonuclease/phosphatase family protein [Solirubrobacteraceae bacterium]|nr:endonuclease/exonuclease/phosphatase family protein [Solirubrobacteraceae bacterium]